MKKKYLLPLMLPLCLLLTACGVPENAVFVQPVSELSQLDSLGAGDRFPGMVVSENVAAVQKDGQQVIAEVLVKVGDDVTEGQELFRYDVDQLQLALDKQKLELEQLKAAIENYKEQIADLKKDEADAKGSSKLQYTIQIQSLEIDLKEGELNLAAKETEVARAEEMLTDASVTAPVAGRITAINENGYDNYGNPLPYITIQQAGAYRVKGSMSELQMGCVMEGSRMKVISRTDETQVWYGTVVSIDYESASQGDSGNMYIGGYVDPMTSSSKYPFYVELDAYEGLLLGQHVYLEADSGEAAFSGLSIIGAFLCYGEDGSVYVWAENAGKLEKRPVTLGEYNYMTDTVQILAGLTEADFIAFPDEALCVEGAPTTRVMPAADEEGGVA